MVTQTDWANIAPDVARMLWGAAAREKQDEWRWGSNGSRKLDLRRGLWTDYEAGDSGGVLALVEREKGVDRAGALNWLRAEGFIAENPGSGAYRQKTAPAQSPYSDDFRPTRARIPTDARKPQPTPQIRRNDELLSQRQSAQGAAPVREWFGRFGLGEHIPDSLRWIDAAAINASRAVADTEGAGAIVYPLTDLNTGERRGAGLVFIHADGRKAEPDKRTLALSRSGVSGAVFSVGELNAGRLVVVEGLKDALAAWRCLGYQAIALNGTPSDAHAAAISEYQQAHSIPRVLLYPEGEEQSQAYGAWRTLGLRLNVRARVLPVKDWGDMPALVDWELPLQVRRDMYAPEPGICAACGIEIEGGFECAECAERTAL